MPASWRERRDASTREELGSSMSHDAGDSHAGEVRTVGRAQSVLDCVRTNGGFAAVSYGLWWTVLFSNGLNGPSWLPLLQSDATLAQTARILLYTLYAGMFVVALLARRRLAPLRDRFGLLAAASALASVGLVLMGLSGFGALPVGTLYAGVCLFAVGTMVPILAIGELFFLMGAEKSCVNTCLSLALAAPSFFLIAWLGSVAFPAAIALEAVCPPLALAALRRAWRDQPWSEDRVAIERGPLKSPAGMLAAMCVYGVAFGVVLGLGARSQALSFVDLVANAGFVALLSLGVLALVGSTRPFSIGRVYRPVLPLIAIGLILLSMLGPVGSVVSTGVVLAGYASSRIFAMTMYADLVVRVPASSYGNAAVAALADAAGVAIGSLAAQILLDGVGVEGQQAYNAAMAVVALLIIVTTFFLSESRIETLWGYLPAKQESPMSELPVEEACDMAADRFGLTPRETEVLVHLVRGESAGEIADALTISKSTVLTHTKRVYAKLDVHSRVELMNAVCFSEPSGADRR